MTPVVPPDRRRLLFVLPFAPSLAATHGGARVMTQLVFAMADRHDVAALHLRGDEEPAVDDALRSRLAHLEEVPMPRTLTLRERLRRRTAGWRGMPAWAEFMNVRAMAERVSAFAAAWRPQVVHFEYHVMAQYVAALRGLTTFRILTQYEAGVLAAREHMATGAGGDRFDALLERRAWVRYERRMMRRMDAVVVFSDRDRTALAPLAGRTPLVTIGFSTPVPPVALDPVGSVAPPRLVFVANFQHPPNVDAARWLTAEIFPAVRRAVPTAMLDLVGANPPVELTTAAGSGITVTGAVPDVTPFVDAASVVVAPLRLGGGMRVKVLEALASGKALVATSRALEGVDVADGVHAAVADTTDAMVERLVALLRAPNDRAALARRARTWACRHLGTQRWIREYEALYDTLEIAEARHRAR